MVTVDSAKIFQLGNFCDSRGNLSVVEGGQYIPFDIKRCFWISDIPDDKQRGAHAHRECHQFLIACRGTFEVALDDGVNKRVVRLDKPYEGLHVPPGLWAAEQNFSPEAVCLVMASEHYDEADYIRVYEDYLKYRNVK